MMSKLLYFDRIPCRFIVHGSKLSSYSPIFGHTAVEREPISAHIEQTPRRGTISAVVVVVVEAGERRNPGRNEKEKKKRKISKERKKRKLSKLPYDAARIDGHRCTWSPKFNRIGHSTAQSAPISIWHAWAVHTKQRRSVQEDTTCVDGVAWRRQMHENRSQKHDVEVIAPLSPSSPPPDSGSTPESGSTVTA